MCMKKPGLLFMDKRAWSIDERNVTMIPNRVLSCLSQSFVIHWKVADNGYCAFDAVVSCKSSFY